MKKLLFLLYLFMSISVANSQNEFVTVKGGQFFLDETPYTYLGTNFWYGMNLGAFEKERLIRELDHLKSIGLTNLRIMASSEGPDSHPYRLSPALQTSPGVYNDSLWNGLDFLLVEMKKRDLKAVLCLSNFWHWSGGLGQYLVWANELDSIPYPPPAPDGSWNKYQQAISKFYQSSKAITLLENHIKKVINRENSISGTHYKDDPTIMSWELCNEPRGMQHTKSFNKWIKQTSKLIKSIDSNHLVTIGSEGSTPFPKYAGLNFKKNHKIKTIDYSTIHIWIENFGWYNPKKSQTYKGAVKKALSYLNKHAQLSEKINKPLVLEEFGIARDSGSFSPKSTTTFRDAYFETIFGKCIELKSKNNSISGINFWAWAGEGRANTEVGNHWKQGDPIIGDPPHEPQGWYSVYDTDTSTLKILKKYTESFSK